MKKAKAGYIGAPACFALEMACKQVRAAFIDETKFGGVYIVGSCLERPDWRDVDVRFMLEDSAFEALFPATNSTSAAAWEHDARWTLLVTAISQWMQQQTGLPIDFQFQPMTFANEWHKGARHSVGMRYVK